MTFKIELIKGVYKAMNILNKIENKDCLEYLKALENESVDCCITDEPYGILTGHKIEEGYNLDIALQVRKEIYRVLKKDAWFIFFSQFPNAWDFGRITFEAGFKPWQQCNEIVWCKKKISSPYGKIMRLHENIFVFQKGKPETYDNKAPYEEVIIPNSFNGISSESNLNKYFAELKRQVKNGTFETGKVKASRKYNDETYQQYGKKEHFSYQENCKLSSIWSFVSENRMHWNSHNIKHPTVKSLLLLRRLVKLFTKQGDVILDCFGGSGTTFLAAKQEGRNFLGCEIDKKYYEIINERLEDWETDLERQDKWLKDRGVNDFNSDIQQTVQSKASLFKNE